MKYIHFIVPLTKSRVQGNFGFMGWSNYIVPGGGNYSIPARDYVNIIESTPFTKIHIFENKTDPMREHIYHNFESTYSFSMQIVRISIFFVCNAYFLNLWILTVGDDGKS